VVLLQNCGKKKEGQEPKGQCKQEMKKNVVFRGKPFISESREQHKSGGKPAQSRVVGGFAAREEMKGWEGGARSTRRGVGRLGVRNGGRP
jgi:hypothetical protein